jgi:hypothetical protein
MTSLGTHTGPGHNTANTPMFFYWGWRNTLKVDNDDDPFSCDRTQEYTATYHIRKYCLLLRSGNQNGVYFLLHSTRTHTHITKKHTSNNIQLWQLHTAEWNSLFLFYIVLFLFHFMRHLQTCTLRKCGCQNDFLWSDQNFLKVVGQFPCVGSCRT